MKKMKKSKPKARSLPAQALQKSDPPATEIGAASPKLQQLSGLSSPAAPPPAPPPPPPPPQTATTLQRPGSGLRKEEQPLPAIQRTSFVQSSSLTSSRRLNDSAPKEVPGIKNRLDDWLTNDKLVLGKNNLKSSTGIGQVVKVDRDVLFDNHKIFSYFPLEKIEGVFSKVTNCSSISLMGVDQVTDMLFICMNHLFAGNAFTRYVGSLFLGGCHHLTDLGLLYIIKTFPALSNVILSGCDKITNDGLGDLLTKTTSKRLQTVKLNATDISIVVPLPEPATQSNIRINYYGCPVISPPLKTMEVQEAFSRHQYFCDLVALPEYSTHKVVVCKNPALKTSLVDIISPGDQSRPNPVQTLMGRKTKKGTELNIVECPLAMTAAFSTPRTIYVVTFSLDEDINKSLPDVELAVLDILRQHPRAVFCLVGVTETGEPACTPDKLRDLLMKKLVTGRDSQIQTLNKTIEKIFQRLYLDYKPLDFAMQEGLANVWRLKEALLDELQSRIFTCTVDVNKKSEAGVSVDTTLSEAASVNNRQHPSYEHLPAALISDLQHVPQVKGLQEIDSVAKELRTKLEKKYGEPLKPYLKMLDLLALLGKATVFTVMDKSYVVTDLEWFAEFLSVLMSSSAKGADHHTKYLHPDTPTLPVDGVTDKLKALFSSESKILSSVQTVLSAFNLGWQDDKDIIFARDLKPEPPVPVEPLLRDNSGDAAISVCFTCHQPLSQREVHFFMARVTQDVKPLLLWDRGVLIQLAPFQILIKFEGPEAKNSSQISRVTLFATCYCGAATGKDLTKIYSILEERMAYYRLVLEYTFKQWNVSYTYGGETDFEYKTKLFNFDEEQYKKDSWKLANHHDILPSKGPEHEGRLICSECGIEENVMLNTWSMEQVVRPCFTGYTWSPLTGSNVKILQKGNWFTMPPTLTGDSSKTTGVKWNMPLLAESFATFKMIVEAGNCCVVVRVGTTEYKMEKEKSGRVRMLKEENNTQIEENTGLGLFDGGNTLEVRVKQKPKVQVERPRISLPKTEDDQEKIVRDIKLLDSTMSLRIALWEGTAMYCDINVGDHIIVSDGSVSYNGYYDVKTINVQFPDMIIKAKPIELNSTLDPSNDSTNAARRFADKAEELRRKTNALKSDAKMCIYLEFICGGEVVWDVDTDWHYTSSAGVSFAVYSGQQITFYLDVSKCVKPVQKPEWKIGMRLEAKDRLNPGLMCPANVNYISPDGQTIGVNFDGWTSKFDYKAEVTTPDFHPIGFAKHMHKRLEDPKGYRKLFDWNEYLDKIDMLAAPYDLFTPEQTLGCPPFDRVEANNSKITATTSKLLHCTRADMIRELYHKFRAMQDGFNPESLMPKVNELVLPLVILLPSGKSLTELTYPKIFNQEDQKIHFLCLNNGYVHIINMDGIVDQQLAGRLIEHWSISGAMYMLMSIQEHFLPRDVQKLVKDASTISSLELEGYLREEFRRMLAISMVTAMNVDNNTVEKAYAEICQDAMDLANKTLNFAEIMVKVEERYWCCDHMRLGPNTRLTAVDLSVIQNVQHLTTELDLSKNDISALPADLFTSLPMLRTLSLAQNKISQLPSFKGASKLRSLDVSSNLLKTFPDDLHTQAPEVGKLNLSGNPMPEIPGCVLNCQQLKELYVKDLGLAVIQKAITQLKKLEILDISGHTLTQIPEEIGLLEKLTQLDISGIAWFSEYDNARSVLSRQAFDDVMAGNRITAGLSDKEKSILFNGEDGGQESTLDYKGITRLNTALYSSLPRLGQDSTAEGGTEESQKEVEALLAPLFKLRKLVSLRMKYLAIREVPAGIAQFTDLKTLDVSHCPSLEAISSEIVACKLTSLNVKDCGSLKTPPKEIIRRGFMAMMGYLKRLQMGSVTCKRTKLMMVGLGGAGKTSTIKAMMSSRQSYSGDLHVTDGIDIMKWDVCYDKSTKEDNTITYSVWDFAGQTVYYNTHQFFLSNRAVYLLMWNVRLGHEHAGLDFWLSSIACHAPKAPVLVIGTHVDQVEKFWLPEEALKKRFPQIVAFHSVSSYTGQGINELSREIYDVALKEKYMGEKIPQVWLKFEESIVRVGKATEENKEKKDLLEWSEVSKLAEDVGIVDGQELKQATRFLHDLGSLQHFENDSLKSKVVINPQWIVNVMSCVVSVHENAIKDGKLKHTDLAQIWSDYPADLHKWLLRLTEEFDLTFPLLDEPANLVACLLPDKEPEFTWQDVSEIPGQHETKMLYKFEYLPAGLFNRAQVRLSQFSDSAVIWKRGSLLHKTGHRALMKQLPGSQVEVKVQGHCPENFLFLVHEVFETLIIEAYNGVTYDFLVPCSDCIRVGTYDPCMFEASKIRRATELKVPFLQCDKYFHTLSLTEVQGSMPPDTSSDFDAHLERNLRDLTDLRFDMETDVFLFYCGGDVPDNGEEEKKIAPRKIYQDLVNEGFKVWFTPDPNSVDLKSVALTMKNAKLVVVLLSDKFVQDDQCCNVFYYAQHTLHKRVQIIVIGGNQWQKTDIGMQMASEVYIKMDNPNRYKHKKVELFDAVSSKTAKKKVTHPECFVSYCWSNSKDAIAKGSRKIEDALGWGDPREFKKHLEEKGIACWMDIERVGQGGLFEDIAEGLRHAKVVVACVSDEYAKSKNCQMELRFATSILKLPMVVVIVGTGYGWEATEVGMLTLGFPKINSQYESPTVLDRLVTSVKSALPKDGKKEEEEESKNDSNNAQQQAYQELLELAQRKFLRQVAGYANSVDIGSYPRLFFIDFVTKNDKDAAGQPLLTEAEDKEKTDKYIVRVLCEYEQGWHVPCRGYPIPELSSAELDDFLIRMAPYGARIMGILRHTALDYPVLNTERGDKLRGILEENCLVDKDFKDEYSQCREFLIGLDQDQSMGGLTQCHMPNGKVLWLCKEHSATDERISSMDNAGAMVDQSTSIDLSQSQDKTKLSQLRGKLKGAAAAACMAGAMGVAHQSSKTCSVM